MKKITTNNTHRVRLKTLTPLHIGVSQEYWWEKGIDFLQKNDKVYIIDSNKLLKSLDKQEVDTLVSNLSNGDTDSFSDYLLSQRHINLEEISYYSINSEGSFPSEIRPMTNSQTAQGREIFLPSSSLKGSVRTAVLSDLIFENPNFVTKRENLGSEHRYKKGQFNFSDTRVQKYYLGRDAKNDLFRLVRFSDFYFSETECNTLQILNLRGRNTWSFKKSQSAHLECISKGQVSEGTLQIPKELKRLTSKSQIKRTEIVNIEKLCQTINNNILDLLHHEIAFWEEERNIPVFVEDYLDALRQIQEVAQDCKNQKGQCVLRVGWGSGWDFITGAWAKDKFNDSDWRLLQQSLRKKRYDEDVPFPKTRKLTQRNEPLGFLKMEIL